MRRVLAILALTLLAQAADATSRQQNLGARALAMGGAFVVASDASAAHWNPAALATLQRQELGGTPCWV